MADLSGSTMPAFSMTPAVPPGYYKYPRPQVPGCNTIGDCVTASVKWGHPAPYCFSGQCPAPLKCSDTNAIFDDAAADANSTQGGNRDLSQSVALPYQFPQQPDPSRYGGITLTVNVNNGVPLVWQDLFSIWTAFSYIPCEFTQGTDGIIWDRNDASSRVGSYKISV